MENELAGNVEMPQQINPVRKRWRIPTVILSIGYLIGLYLLDFGVLTPLVLPENHCYYHWHEVPFLVDWLYMSPGSNGHPDGSMTHFILLLVLSIFLGYITTKTIRKKLSKIKMW
jgi:hypothetical protein